MADEEQEYLRSEEEEDAGRGTLHASPVPVHVRLMAASSGAFLTSFFTTPFDLIKTRLQAQGQTSPSPQQSLVWQDCTLRSCGLPPQSCLHHRKIFPLDIPKYSGS